MTITLNKLTKGQYPFLKDEDIDKIVPVMYGLVSSVSVPCLNANSDGEAFYKLPDLTSDVGTVYIKKDDIWARGSVVSVDYEKGIMELENGRSDAGSDYECKLVDCKGYMNDAHCYPKDALIHFIENYGKIKYISSNFDITTFESELAHTKLQYDIGFLVEENVSLWDQIFTISQSCGIKFRVDEDSQGRITAKVRDFERTAISTPIASADILNANKISFSSDLTELAASITLNYYHNFEADTDLSVENTTYKKEVGKIYRTQDALEIDTYLSTEAGALSRAYEEATRSADEARVAELTVFENLDLELLDVVTVSLMPDNLAADSRQFAGNRDCIVKSVNPDYDKKINVISVQIIPDRTPSISQEAVRSGSYTTLERSKSTIDLVKETIDSTLKVSGYLSKKACTLFADKDGVVTDFTLATGTFYVYNLGTLVTDDVTFALKSATGCTAGITSAGVYSVTAISADNAEAVFTATYSGVIIEDTFTLSKSTTGATGAQGVAGSGAFIVITDINETESTYPNNQPGAFNGFNYKWIVTGTNLGYWTPLKETSVSVGEAVQYLSFDDTLPMYGLIACVDGTGNDNTGYATGASKTTGFSGSAVLLDTRSSYIDL